MIKISPELEEIIKSMKTLDEDNFSNNLYLNAIEYQREGSIILALPFFFAAASRFQKDLDESRVEAEDYFETLVKLKECYDFLRVYVGLDQENKSSIDLGSWAEWMEKSLDVERMIKSYQNPNS